MATSSNFSTSNQYIKYRIVVTENSYDIATNKSNITVTVDAWRTNTGYTTDDDGTCYCNINGTGYSNSWSYGQKPIRYNSHTVLFSKTLDIEHDADGKKTIYVSAYIRHDKFSSNSQGFNVALTDIPRQANIIRGANFFDYVNPSFTYSNPAGDAVEDLQACISLDNSTPLISYRAVDKLGSSFTFELTTAERNTLLQATPNSNRLDLYYILKTTIAGVTYYSSFSAFMGIDENQASPTITGATYEDTNASTLAITSDATKIIQANSTVRINLASITALKYATLVSVAVTINAVTIYKALSGASVTNEYVDFGVVNSSENIDAYVTVTDSRGNQTSTTVSLTMYAWALPTAVISLKRKDNYYAETHLKVTSSISSLGGNNSVAIQYQYKETTAGSYGALTTIQDDTDVTITIDNTKAYDFKILVTDLLGTTTYNTVLQVGLPILFIDRLLRSIGIGTIPEQVNMLAVDRRIHLKNTLQEAMLDLWTTVTTSDERGASLIFYNKDGDEVARLTGYEGGRLTMSHTYANGNKLGFVAGAGYQNIKNVNEKDIFSVYDNNGNGIMTLNDSNGNPRLYLWVGGNNDGVVDVKDNNGDTTINLTGATGKVTCKAVETEKVKQTNGVVEVVDTSFNSGNKTFNNDGYQTLTVVAKVTSTSSYNIINIPVMFLDDTNKRFCISDEANYITFNVKLDNGVYTVAWYSASSTGSIEKIYAHY